MLIQDLKSHIKSPIKGVIHIGAHVAEEKNWYTKNNINDIIWIEANKEYYEKIKNTVGNDLIIMNAVGNISGNQKFNISNNGQSSSLLDLEVHKKHHPDVNYVKTIEIEVKRMVDIIYENNINIKKYNFINLDIQGYELEALKSFDELLNNFDYIYTEINTNYLYKNCALVSEIDSYLKNFGFIRVETRLTQWEWGDAFYSRIDLS